MQSTADEKAQKNSSLAPISNTIMHEFQAYLWCSEKKNHPSAIQECKIYSKITNPSMRK